LRINDGDEEEDDDDNNEECDAFDRAEKEEVQIKRQKESKREEKRCPP